MARLYKIRIIKIIDFIENKDIWVILNLRIQNIFCLFIILFLNIQKNKIRQLIYQIFVFEYILFLYISYKYTL